MADLRKDSEHRNGDLSSLENLAWCVGPSLVNPPSAGLPPRTTPVTEMPELSPGCRTKEYLQVTLHFCFLRRRGIETASEGESGWLLGWPLLPNSGVPCWGSNSELAWTWERKRKRTGTCPWTLSFAKTYRSRKWGWGDRWPTLSWWSLFPKCHWTGRWSSQDTHANRLHNHLWASDQYATSPAHQGHRLGTHVPGSLTITSVICIHPTR